MAKRTSKPAKPAPPAPAETPHNWDKIRKGSRIIFKNIQTSTPFIVMAICIGYTEYESAQKALETGEKPVYITIITTTTIKIPLSRCFCSD